jgi:hypothetical protein
MAHAGGRPKIVIDYALAEKLAFIQCTVLEIAHMLNVNEKTLLKNKQFMELHKKGQENGKSSLRRLQWKSAEAGNVTAQIWLGKQYLGQRDKSELTGKDGQPLVPQPIIQTYTPEAKTEVEYVINVAKVGSLN